VLERLSIHDYALIERVNLSFAAGLNVLTGETGAGKSILVGALGLLLGQKAGPDTVRAGAEEAKIAGTVGLKGNPEALSWLDRRDIHPEDDTVILRRTVKTGGRGSSYVQSTPVTRAELAELTGLLFDLHGQHEHQSLLQPEVHRRYLDRFGGLEDQVGQFGTRFQRLAGLRERLSHLQTDERERLRQVELMEHAVREISAADLTAEEERDLEKERNILTHAEQLYTHLDRAYASLAESVAGALAGLRGARKALEEAAGIDSGLAALAHGVESSYYDVESHAEGLREYRDRINFDPARLEQVEQRLATIRALERKYGDTVLDVLAYAERCRSELASLSSGVEERGAIEREVAELERELVLRAEKLTALRRSAAASLEKRIVAELGGLGMPKARFAVSLSARENAEGRAVFGPSGKDHVEFLISPNPGEPLRKLAAIASGGEISRVMLAIKCVLADQDSIGSLIFDEVDVGIGGEVALAVGTKLMELGRAKQVLCITHLATIAVRAANHLRVEKSQREGRTVTEVRAVVAEERVVEVARMLSGDRSSETSLGHARELLERYGPSLNARGRGGS
jgi:DNA repair protein RecN (Recombination protein N)